MWADSYSGFQLRVGRELTSGHECKCLWCGLSLGRRKELPLPNRLGGLRECPEILQRSPGQSPGRKRISVFSVCHRLPQYYSCNKNRNTIHLNPDPADFRHRISESGIWHKFNICPYLIVTEDEMENKCTNYNCDLNKQLLPNIALPVILVLFTLVTLTRHFWNKCRFYFNYLWRCLIGLSRWWSVSGTRCCFRGRLKSHQNGNLNTIF